MMKSDLLVLIMVVLLTDCNYVAPYEKLDFSIAMQQKIKSQINRGKIIVYYHSGECSFCYGTLLAISKEFPGLPIVSISSSHNVVQIDYYMEQIQFKGISLIDSTSLFLKRNQKALSTQNLFLIDSQYNIIAGGIDLDKRTKEKINQAIR